MVVCFGVDVFIGIRNLFFFGFGLIMFLNMLVEQDWIML